ncbi:MAG: accessory gene regulator B family protein [Peptostreptococcaceae bacterium]
MSVIEKVSYNISNKIGNKANKSKDEIEVINYGLFMAIHTLVSIIITIIVGVLIGKLNEILLISLVASSLKRCSGGVHATSPNRCLIIGVITSIIFTYISLIFGRYSDLKNLIIFSALILSTCYFVFYKKAPVGTKNKPLKKESIRKKLRKKLFITLNLYYILIAIFILCMFENLIDYNFINYIYCVELGIVLQCMSLTKFGEYTILKLDSILTYKNI